MIICIEIDVHGANERQFEKESFDAGGNEVMRGGSRAVENGRVFC